MKYRNIKKCLFYGGLVLFSASCDESFDYLNSKNHPPTLEVNDLELNDNNEFNASLTVLNNEFATTSYKLSLRSTDVDQNIKGFTLSSLEGLIMVDRASDSTDIKMNTEYSFSKSVASVYTEDLFLSFMGSGETTFKIEVKDNFGESAFSFFTIVVISEINKVPSVVLQSIFNGETTICDGGNYTFDASDSNDEDGSIILYEFILNGDTILTNSNSISKTFYIQEVNNSTVPVSIRVFDNKGVSSQTISTNLNINR